MDNLQYSPLNSKEAVDEAHSFKPYYKWIIFNIAIMDPLHKASTLGFKPYYKWIIFNIFTHSLSEIQ